jgi:SET domain-containing protein
MTSPSEALQTYRLISHHEMAEVVFNPETQQKALIARKSFSPGELICPFYAGSTHSEPSYLTVQVGDNKHITLQPEFLQYTNHSCDPNAFFDTTTMEFIALKEIQPGDELTFFYPSTEWEMAQPFQCRCGTAQCIGTIEGASQLSAEVLGRYRLTDYIKTYKTLSSGS